MIIKKYDLIVLIALVILSGNIVGDLQQVPQLSGRLELVRALKEEQREIEIIEIVEEKMVIIGDEKYGR